MGLHSGKQCLGLLMTAETYNLVGAFFEHLEEGCGKKIEDCGLMRKRNQTVMLRSNNFDSTT